jgi:hypothetical protein
MSPRHTYFPEAIRHRGHRICGKRISNPMTPMPHAPGSSCLCLAKRPALRSPSAVAVLAQQNKAGATRQGVGGV